MRFKFFPVIILFMVLGALFAVGVQPSHATALMQLNNATVYCDAAVITYTVYGFPSIQVRAITDGTPISGAVTSPGNGSGTPQTYTVTILFTSTQPDGTVIEFQYTSGGSFQQLPPGNLFECSGLLPEEASSAPADPRLQVGADDGYVVLYDVLENPDNPVLAFYCIDRESVGRLAYYVSQREMEQEYPTPPARNTLIHRSEICRFSFYILTTGEFQINAGPDDSGVTEVLVFTGFPPSNLRRYSFSPRSQPLRKAFWTFSQ